MIGPHDEKRLRALLADKYGTILSLTEECPLVYYVCAAMKDGAAVPQEYFVVDRKSPAISKVAKGYGSPLDMEPELLCYAFSDIHSGYKIIQYEIYRYRLKHGLPLDAPESVHEYSIHSAEEHPEYFGTYPAPMVTPGGDMVRYCVLSNGVCYIETDRGMDLIAVSFPLWQALSQYARKLGRLTGYDLSQGTEHAKGYLFFSIEDSCLPLFELWVEHPEWGQHPALSFPALMNAIWERFPEYAAAYNTAEQSGINSIASFLPAPAEGWDIEARQEKAIFGILNRLDR